MRIYTSFYYWLQQQDEREDAIGDFARDAMQDRKFKSLATYDDIKFHLNGYEAIPEAHEAFENAWNEWLSIT